MSKPIAVISCPIDVYGGYPARSRDFVKALYNKKKDDWDIKIIPQRWGSLPWGYIEDHIDKWGWIQPLVINQLTSQPDYFFQITVPNEFQPIGKWNCGITAGIETTICDGSWIEGCNRMNLVIVPSRFSKEVFTNTKFEKRDQRNQPIGIVELKTPIEVLFEGVDNEEFFFFNDNDKENRGIDGVYESISSIPEKFLFLTAGHWMQGDLGEDRKNIGLTVRSFFEAFKNSKSDVALVLKTSAAGSSIMDRDEILKRISNIKRMVGGETPNVYLLHGEISNKEMNELYNHPKIKAMVSLTKGEGFGRPLIEFALTKKPIAVSGWSGHTDFLDPKHTYFIKGSLKNIHKSAQVPNVLIEGSQWFYPDLNEVNRMWKSLHSDYKDYLEPARIQAHKIKTKFNLNEMSNLLESIIKEKAPEIKPLVLPQLPKLKLPELRKIEEVTKT